MLVPDARGGERAARDIAIPSMKRTKGKIDAPSPVKAPKTAASSSEPLSAAVPNPLKDKALIQAAAIAAARELVAGCATFTGAQFSRRVIEKMGYGCEFAVNDQGTRTRLHVKDVKLAAFEAVGAGFDGVGLKGCSSLASEWLKAHEVKPGPAAPVALPELPAGGAPPRQLSAAELSAMRARVADASADALREHGALRIPGLLTPGQAEECLLALGAEGALATKALLPLALPLPLALTLPQGTPAPRRTLPPSPNPTRAYPYP